MGDTTLSSGWDTAVVLVVFIGLMLCGIFRLDELFAKRKTGSKRPRSRVGHEDDGEPIISDPDGRPWRRRKTPK